LNKKRRMISMNEIEKFVREISPDPIYFFDTIRETVPKVEKIVFEHSAEEEYVGMFIYLKSDELYHLNAHNFTREEFWNIVDGNNKKIDMEKFKSLHEEQNEQCKCPICRAEAIIEVSKDLISKWNNLFLGFEEEMCEKYIANQLYIALSNCIQWMEFVLDNMGGEDD